MLLCIILETFLKASFNILETVGHLWFGKKINQNVIKWLAGIQENEYNMNYWVEIELFLQIFKILALLCCYNSHMLGLKLLFCVQRK